MAYEDPDIPIDPEALLEIGRQIIRAQFPQWEGDDADVVSWLLEAIAVIASALGTDARSGLARGSYEDWARTMLELPRNGPARASVLSTWTLTDRAGYTIPGGTQVFLQVTGDDVVTFEVADDVVVAPAGGVGTAVVEGVLLVAAEAGAAGSGIDAATPAEPDALTFVESVELEADTTGGRDEEDLVTYLGRVRDEVRTFAAHVVGEDDAETVARRVPAVASALAVDLFDPSDGTTGHTATLAIFPVDVAGASVGPTGRADVLALLEARREPGFVFHVEDAAYEAVDVDFQVRAFAGEDTDAVEAACVAAVTAYLQPAPYAGITDGSLTWRRPVINEYEIGRILDEVPGVDSPLDVTIAGAVSGELTLAGYDGAGTGALPTPGDITGTAVAP